MESRPNTEFKEKLAHWRKHGLAVRYQGGRDFWRRTTVAAEQRRVVEEARARGADPVPYKSVWGNR